MFSEFRAVRICVCLCVFLARADKCGNDGVVWCTNFGLFMHDWRGIWLGRVQNRNYELNLANFELNSFPGNATDIKIIIDKTQNYY